MNNNTNLSSIPTAGILHSVERLLELLIQNPLSTEELFEAFDKIRVCPPHSVLNLAQRCNWVKVTVEGHIKLTSRGQKLLDASGYEDRLRRQLCDYITIENPGWGRLIPRGRVEMQQFAPTDIVQVFREAELFLSPPSTEIISWWDKMAGLVRGNMDAARLEIGREGEKLSLEFEKQRTKTEPIWQSVESNLSGYDILSQIDSGTRQSLCIEVKASREAIDNAIFFISRNEWLTAKSSAAYCFHLWCLRNASQPSLANLSVEKVEEHIPENRGVGQWETARIQFNIFREDFITCSELMC